MKTILALLSVVLFSVPAFSNDHRAREKARAQAAVAVAMAHASVCDCSVCDLSKCDGNCSTDGCKLSSVVRPVVPVQVTRSAQGHTHTCANGHTWDHTMDGGSHRCPVCGLSQYVVDSPGRQLTGSSSSMSYSLGVGSIQGGCSGSGCVSGSCSSASVPQRRGLFGRVRQ